MMNRKFIKFFALTLAIVLALSSSVFANTHHNQAHYEASQILSSPGSCPGSAVLLSRFTNLQAPFGRNIAIGPNLPGADGFYFELPRAYVTPALRTNTTITLISPHEGLRFRIYQRDAYLAQDNNALVFDSHTPQAGVRNPNRGYRINIPAQGGTRGFVQKINAACLGNAQRIPGWLPDRDYFIVVYIHPSFIDSTTPVGNGREFHLIVGEGMRGPNATGTRRTSDVSWSLSFSQTRTSGTVNILNRYASNDARSHPHTVRVSQVELLTTGFPMANWSMTVENLDQPGSRITWSGGFLNGAVRRPANPTQAWNPRMNGTWHIVINHTFSRPPGIRPEIYFHYSWEIGD